MEKTVLITGGSRGIGAACVEAFAAAGCRVVFSYLHSQEQAAALCARWEGRALAVQADVADRDQVTALFRQAEHGRQRKNRANLRISAVYI